MSRRHKYKQHKSRSGSLLRNRTLIRTILIIICLVLLSIFLITFNTNIFIALAFVGLILFIYWESTLTLEEKRRRAEKQAKQREEREHYKRVEKEAYISGRAQERGRMRAERDEVQRKAEVEYQKKLRKKMFGGWR
ncbi:MAG: hypothetical protein ABIH25_01285 [Candidatus Woesearchaeota archaeon]